MKKLIIFAAIAVLTAALCVSCKQKNKDIELLQNFVEEINSQPGKDLANGTVLTKCEYKQGDSLFTYRIKVSDDRFSNVAADSVKSTLSKKLTEAGNAETCKDTVAQFYRTSVCLRDGRQRDDRSVHSF